MFFTCPKCNTVYDVPAEQVDTARQLRCAMCGHLWEPAAETEDVEEEKNETEHSFPMDGDEADDLPVFPDADADPFANESDLTAFKPIFQTPEEQPAEKRWLRPLYFSSMVFIAIGLYAFFFHLPNKTPLEFRSLSPEYVEKDYQTTLILNAVVQNRSAVDVNGQGFQVFYYDKNGKEVTQADFPVRQTFKANAATPVKLEVGRPPAQAERATLQIKALKL